MGPLERLEGFTQCRRGLGPLVRAGVEARDHEVGHVVGDALEAGSFPVDGAEQQGRHRLASLGGEGGVARDQGVDRGAERVDVAAFVGLVAPEHLGGHEAGGELCGGG